VLITKGRIAIIAFSILLGLLGTASLAQAEWLAKGETFEEAGVKEEGITGSGGAFKFTVATLSVTYKCNKVSSTGKVIQGGTDKETLKFTECKVFNSKEVELKACPIVEPITFEAKTELVEVEGIVYDKFTPANEKSFGTIKFKSEECSIGTEVVVSGSTAAQLKEEELIEQPFTFSEKATSATKTGLLFGKNAATIEGTLTQALSETKKGTEWQGAVVTTALCRTNALMTCAGAEIFARFSAVESALEGAGKAVLKLVGTTLQPECNKSILNSETLTKRAQPVLLKVLNFTLEECNEACTVTESTIGPAASAVRAIQGEFPNGNLTFAKIKIKLVCGGLVPRTCVYEQTNLVEKMLGGMNAKIKVNEAEITRTSGMAAVCGSEAKWTGNYLVSAVAPLYVTK
jgi:hypothetical protein